MDIHDDGGAANPDGDVADTDENITYTLSGGELQRNGEAIAENIEALNFVYLDGSDPSNVLNPGLSDVAAADLESIQAVVITLVARAAKPGKGFTNVTAYSNQEGDVILSAQNDAYRRKSLTSEIKFRNLGV